MKAPEPGLYASVPFAEYFSWEAANASTLRHFTRSAAHARHEMLHPSEPTPALDFGSKVHLAILEPERFEVEAVEGLTIPRRKNADKEAHKAFEAANANKYILLPGELDRIRAMQEAVYAHPVAAEIIVSKPAQNECGIVWVDEQTGMVCKGRADLLREHMGYAWEVDLKTCADASPEVFMRSINKYGYHQSAAFYRDGLTALGQEGVRCALLAVEKDPPYGVALYELDDASLDLGRQQYRANLAKYAECVKTGEWPGYRTEMGLAGLPAYALKGWSDGD